MQKQSLLTKVSVITSKNQFHSLILITFINKPFCKSGFFYTEAEIKQFLIICTLNLHFKFDCTAYFTHSTQIFRTNILKVTQIANVTVDLFRHKIKWRILDGFPPKP